MDRFFSLYFCLEKLPAIETRLILFRRKDRSFVVHQHVEHTQSLIKIVQFQTMIVENKNRTHDSQFIVKLSSMLPSNVGAIFENRRLMIIIEPEKEENCWRKIVGGKKRLNQLDSQHLNCCRVCVSVYPLYQTICIDHGNVDGRRIKSAGIK